MMRRIVVFAVTCLAVCESYKLYQNHLPNGASVPHPCKPNHIWEGVGHQNVLGGGVRNPFGVDFQDAGFRWTRTLCRRDSDGDGRTNGEELGDPRCVWTRGSIPHTAVGLSHPGVCEPTNSTECLARNNWAIDCSDGANFTCEGIDDPDTINVTLKFDRTRVPAQETSYMCQSFAIPSDREYHLFAAKPLISNAYVMHHTLVYGCTGPVEGYDTPSPCAMIGSGGCTHLLAGWSLGVKGMLCERGTNGFKVGRGHITTILMQHHWDNPTRKANYYDESGMTLFLTPNLRPNNLGFFLSGQNRLEIPPGRNEYTVSGVCTGSCVRRRISSPMYISTAHLHMHYLGKSGSIEQWRNGRLLDKWFFEEAYSFDSPTVNHFNPPKELRPGDEIRTICNYTTINKSSTTYYGESTSAEMCFGFMTYYPAENGFTNCIATRERDVCNLRMLNSLMSMIRGRFGRF